jgi:hypothetical protein
MTDVLGPSIPLPNPDNEPPWIPHTSKRGYEPLNWRPIPYRHYMAVQAALRVMFEGAMEPVDPEMFAELHRKFLQNAYYRMYVGDIEESPWFPPGVGWKERIKMWGLKGMVTVLLFQDWYEQKMRDFMWLYTMIPKP